MKALIEIRKSKGLSQQDVADYLGISRQAYCNYENDKREASYETLLQLSEYFDVSVDELLGRGSKTKVTDSDIRFALFDGADNITDEMYEEVKRFAEYVKQRENK